MTLWLVIVDALTFIGLAGAVLAVASAVVAATAFAIMGAPDAGAAAVAGWLCCVILSLCGGFEGHWHLPGIAVAAGPTALLLTCLIGLLRAVFSTGRTSA